MDGQRTCVNIDRLFFFVVNFAAGTTVAYGQPAVFADQQRSFIGIVFRPCQCIAVQVEGNISLVKNIVTNAIASMGVACAAVCCDIRQQLHRGACFLLRRVKGGDQVGIGRTVDLCHRAHRLFRYDGRFRSQSFLLLFLHDGAALRRVLRRSHGCGQERQTQRQRHEHTQYSFFHKILL